MIFGGMSLNFFYKKRFLGEESTASVFKNDFLRKKLEVPAPEMACIYYIRYSGKGKKRSGRGEGCGLLVK